MQTSLQQNSVYSVYTRWFMLFKIRDKNKLESSGNNRNKSIRLEEFRRCEVIFKNKRNCLRHVICFTSEITVKKKLDLWDWKGYARLCFGVQGIECMQTSLHPWHYQFINQFIGLLDWIIIKGIGLYHVIRIQYRFGCVPWLYSRNRL